MGINSKIAVCFAANESYSQHLSVAIVSFLANNPKGYDVFILTDYFSEKAQKKIIQDCKIVNARIQVLFIEVTNLLPIEFLGYIDRYPEMAFYRVLIAVLLPEYKFALYIDSDTVTLKRIEFDNLKSEKFAISACRDVWEKKLATGRGLTGYFNSGVLFLNLHLWREKDILKELSSFSPITWEYPDQDLLNCYFHQKWRKLPPSFNMPPVFLKSKMLFLKSKRPHIVHYVGIKPWEMFRDGSYYYWRYLWLTSYRWHFFNGVIYSMLNSFKYLSVKIIKKIKK